MAELRPRMPLSAGTFTCSQSIDLCDEEDAVASGQAPVSCSTATSGLALPKLRLWVDVYGSGFVGGGVWVDACFREAGCSHFEPPCDFTGRSRERVW